jgi:hypothetical protein
MTKQEFEKQKMGGGEVWDGTYPAGKGKLPRYHLAVSVVDMAVGRNVTKSMTGMVAPGDGPARWEVRRLLLQMADAAVRDLAKGEEAHDDEAGV